MTLTGSNKGRAYTPCTSKNNRTTPGQGMMRFHADRHPEGVILWIAIRNDNFNSAPPGMRKSCWERKREIYIPTLTNGCITRSIIPQRVNILISVYKLNATTNAVRGG